MKIPDRKSAAEVAPLTLPPIKAAAILYPNTHEGFMHLRFEDTCVKISVGKRKLGSLEAGIGCTIDLCDEATGTTWCLHPRDLWPAFQAALKAHPEYRALLELRKGKGRE